MNTETDRPSLTKIVATIGPASGSADMIERLIEAGVSVFRLNFSHGDRAGHGRYLRTIREISARLARPIAVMGDLCGPKIRLAGISHGPVTLDSGATVVFDRDPSATTLSGVDCRLTSTYERLVDDVEPGHRVLINDGAVRLLVVGKTADGLTCQVTTGGVVSSGKGINLPDSIVDAPALGRDDQDYVEWAVTNRLDYLAMSFVRCGADIELLRHLIAETSHRAGGVDSRIPIVAKIELPQAVENFDEIAEAADAVMIARGDLGVEMEFARVPVVQKQLLERVQEFGTPCIVATQMLESMIESASPTRAEASDVANAIFDRADAVMLSGETAVGKYPALAVDHMRRIALEAEAYLATLPPLDLAPEELVESHHPTAALAHAVWTMSHDLGARLVVVWSQTGGGARYLSQNYFEIPIIAVSSEESALRRMQLLRGVTPVQMDVPANLGEFTAAVEERLVGEGWAERGDLCILVAGSPLGVPKVTNRIALHTVGNPDSGFAHHRPHST